jgi:hemoglobin-like flavoprotein
MLTSFDAGWDEHPMNPEDVRLVRQSFAQVAPMADTTAEVFYKKLFELDPTLRPLFRTDLTQQGRKLMQMLDAAVALLDRPQALVPTLEGLGRRHAGYGIRDEHYDTMEVALILTLQQGLGPAFTREARSAWIALFDLVAGTMKRAAATEPEWVEIPKLAAAG